MVPGSFKSKINLGTRYVPAPTPGQAWLNTALRNYAPWGPFGVDEPPTGIGGTGGKWAGRIPYAGGVVQAFMASEAARKQQGRMVPVPPATGFWSNLLQTLGNTLQFVPGGGTAKTAAQAGVSGLQGITGAPGMFGSSWESVLTGVGGSAVRGLADRTGVLRSMSQEPTWNAPQAMQWGQERPMAPSWQAPTPEDYGIPSSDFGGPAEVWTDRRRGENIQAP